MDHIHKSVNYFKEIHKIIICGIFSLAIVVAVYVLVLVNGTGSNNTTTDSQSDQEGNGWILAGGIIFFIVGLLLIIFCFITKSIGLTKKWHATIQLYLEDLNFTQYHQRGIHWSLGKQCSNIRIILNFEKR